MTTLLLKHATLLATMDDAGSRWEDGGVYVVDNVIRQVGPTAELPQSADTVIDARGMAVMPGLVNTHHHFFQTLTRIPIIPQPPPLCNSILDSIVSVQIRGQGLIL